MAQSNTIIAEWQFFFNTKKGVYEVDAWFRDNKFTDVEDMKKAVEAHKKEQRYNKYYY